MKEDNRMVLVCLLAIALLSLALVGWVIYQGGDKESSNLLIMLANTVASGMVGYLTKSITSFAGAGQSHDTPTTPATNAEKEKKEEVVTNGKQEV